MVNQPCCCKLPWRLAENKKVLYVSGEESERQIKMRADRLHRDQDGNVPNLPANLLLVTETNLDAILDHADSDQTQSTDRRLHPDQLPTPTGIFCRFCFPGSGMRLSVSGNMPKELGPAFS